MPDRRPGYCRGRATGLMIAGKMYLSIILATCRCAYGYDALSRQIINTSLTTRAGAP
jgi:hypothetical protein